MKIQIHQGHAFVHMGNGQLLCIGTKKEVMYRPEIELARLYLKAVAIGCFNEIQHSPKVTH